MPQQEPNYRKLTKIERIQSHKMLQMVSNSKYLVTQLNQMKQNES